jgi:hypothetical protein
MDMENVMLFIFCLLSGLSAFWLFRVCVYWFEKL